VVEAAASPVVEAVVAAVADGSRPRNIGGSY